MTISQSDGLQNDTGLIAALNLVATGGVTADFHSDGSMKFAGSGRLWPGVWRAHEAGLIAPEGDWERGEQIVLTDAGRATLSQTQASI